MSNELILSKGNGDYQTDGSERDKCELVWEYALSLCFKGDVVFNRVDGGCEIFMEIEDEDEDDEDEYEEEAA